MKAYKCGGTRDFETEGAAREWLAETGGLIIGDRVLMVRNRYGRADLAGADLAGANLRRADLRRADLAGADLRRANLRRANLRRADLAGADLAGANLADANLTDANLTDANLAGANLAGANLRRADLAGADLTDANLTDANLAGANLAGANLRRADLAGADLTDANLTGANLRRADLTDANGLIEAKTIGTSQRTITAYWNGKELRYLAGCRDANESGMRSAIDRDYADRDADRIAYHSAITFLHDAFEALMQRHQIGKYAESKETNEREQSEGVKS